MGDDDVQHWLGVAITYRTGAVGLFGLLLLIAASALVGFGVGQLRRQDRRQPK